MPLDAMTCGELVDDELHECLVKPLPGGVSGPPIWLLEVGFKRLSDLLVVENWLKKTG